MIENDEINRLLQSLTEGSFPAFEKLYNLYSGKLYNFMMRISSGNQYMAEEVVQQTFIRVWEVRERIDPTENFISYLCTIARNMSMNMYQHQTVEYIYTEYLLKSSSDRDQQTEESTDLRFLNDYIDSLAEELPPSRKKIFLLSKRQGYTNKEIAGMLGISESTVATQLSLAVKFMREQFIKHYDKLILILWAFFVNEMQ
ncbi:RNA polymerase sigma-70 factor [Bacteroides oleiciplenus]|uniref:RNA polymerase sigma factor n=1 Tax=Bacteroides oleiciplenus YIT 12058 TaxID=742727 RepID=K9ELS2_9BACE|nr:RNA polymerase sigma-70 factor [Bacteroides oleiciplenus]EKU90105.1 RNA polymerase sigma-70 factor, expansion family 1 [Bacteroides oleiciplenus YIT 12058]